MNLRRPQLPIKKLINKRVTTNLSSEIWEDHMPSLTIMKKPQNSTKTISKNSTDRIWSWIWPNSVSNSKDLKELKLFSTTLYLMRKIWHMKNSNKPLKPISCFTKFISRKEASSIWIQMRKPENKSKLQLSTKSWSLKNWEAKEEQEMSKKGFTLIFTTKSLTTPTLMKRTLKLQSWCSINAWR